VISDTAKSPAVQREGLRLRCRGRIGGRRCASKSGRMQRTGVRHSDTAPSERTPAESNPLLRALTEFGQQYSLWPLPLGSSANPPLQHAPVALWGVSLKTKLTLQISPSWTTQPTSGCWPKSIYCPELALMSSSSECLTHRSLTQLLRTPILWAADLTGLSEARGTPASQLRRH